MSTIDEPETNGSDSNGPVEVVRSEERLNVGTIVRGVGSGGAAPLRGDGHLSPVWH